MLQGMTVEKRYMLLQPRKRLQSSYARKPQALNRGLWTKSASPSLCLSSGITRDSI